MKKNAKKPLLIVLALALVCAASVAGTLAYLTAQTGPVKNTFVAAGLAELVLDESKVEPMTIERFVIDPEGGATLKPFDLPGHYTINPNSTERVTSNGYTIVPGVDVPKDPRITVKNLQVRAYLYLEVVDHTPSTISWTIGNGWKKINRTGAHGGDVYCYSTDLNPSSTDQVFDKLIAGNTVYVSGDYESETQQGEHPGAGDQSLTFYAYLCQADGFNDDRDAWDTTFGASNTSPQP